MRKICPHKVGVIKIVKYSASYTMAAHGKFVCHLWANNNTLTTKRGLLKSLRWMKNLNKRWRLYFFRASKSTMMVVCTPIHEKNLKRSSKIVGTTPSFRQVKILEPPPSSPSFLVEMCQSSHSTSTPFLLT